MSVVGGKLNTTLDESLNLKKNTELKILVLTVNNQLFLWQESDNCLVRCILSLHMNSIVTKIALNINEILLCTHDGQAYHGVIANRKKKSHGYSSSCNSFHKFLDIDLCHSVKLLRIPKIHRACYITTDPKGRSFAILQVND